MYRTKKMEEYNASLPAPNPTGCEIPNLGNQTCYIDMPDSWEDYVRMMKEKNTENILNASNYILKG